MERKFFGFPVVQEEYRGGSAKLGTSNLTAEQLFRWALLKKGGYNLHIRGELFTDSSH